MEKRVRSRRRPTGAAEATRLCVKVPPEPADSPTVTGRRHFALPDRIRNRSGVFPRSLCAVGCRLNPCRRRPWRAFGRQHRAESPSSYRLPGLVRAVAGQHSPNTAPDTHYPRARAPIERDARSRTPVPDRAHRPVSRQLPVDGVLRRGVAASFTGAASVPATRHESPITCADGTD